MTHRHGSLSKPVSLSKPRTGSSRTGSSTHEHRTYDSYVDHRSSVAGFPVRYLFRGLVTALMIVAMVQLAEHGQALGSRITHHFVDNSTPDGASSPTPTPAPDAGPVASFDSTLWILAVLGGLLLTALLAFGLVVAVRRVRRTTSSRRAATTRRRETRAAQLERWGKADTLYAEIAADILTFETVDPRHPQDFLDRHLLSNVDEPDSANFWDAWAAATDLRLDTVPHNDIQIQAYLTATRAAHSAFARADRNARSKATAGVTAGNRHLSRSELRRLDLARKSLAIAYDPGATTDEAAAARRRVIALLADIVTIPAPIEKTITAAIAAADRPALPAAVLTT